MENMTLLMTDSWQPTVLQLMPFSNNNASQSGQLLETRTGAYGKVREFPTLAVTRSRNKGNGKVMRIYSERLSRAAENGKTSQQPRAKSEYSSCVPKSLVTSESAYFVSLEAESESQDSSEIISVSEVHRSMKLLPKPSPCKSVDGRFFVPQNGFRRPVSMTPGEMELQKERTKLLKDAVGDNKYKCSISQLPRSTTPINDNDPDKLNIKHVIRFLQSKESEPIVKGEHNIKKNNKCVKTSGMPTSVASSVSVRSSVEQQKSDVNFSPMLPFRREVTMFTNSISSKKRGKTRSKIPERISKSTVGYVSPFKTTREFRLHRFLTMAPNADELTEITQSRSPKPNSAAQRRLFITEYLRSSEPNKNSRSNLHSRGGERYVKLQYRLPSKRSEILTVHSQISKYSHPQRQVQADCVQDVIRLPSVSDFKNDSDAEDAKEEVWKGEYHDLKASSLSVEESHGDSNGRESLSTSSTRDLKFESSFSPASRKITISLPKDASSNSGDKRKYYSDAVRLTLRHEHVLTREKTYMSDIAQDKSEEHWPGSTVTRDLLNSKHALKHEDGTTVLESWIQPVKSF